MTRSILPLPYSRQSISTKDIKNVVRVLRSNLITTGPYLKLFEKSISNFCKSKFAVSANSATSALHIACLALGVKKNDLVWTTPITFAATANCAIYCGAKIDFVDIDSETFNMSAEALQNKLERVKLKNKLPKVVIPVHLAGQSSEMDKIKKLSSKYGFKIIEDASHAFGGTFKDNMIGNCKFSDITVFSFHPVKTITTGEGGIAVTNKKDIASKMQKYREHGIERDKKKFIGKSHGSWHYQQQNLGYNYRMSDIHAALGLSQMKRVNKFIKKRNSIAKHYIESFKNLPITFQKEKFKTSSTYHLFIVRVSQKIRNKLFEHLKKRKILVNIHYIPIYLHPFYKSFGFKGSEFKNSVNYYNSAISLPIYYDLSKKDQNRVINIIKKFF